MFESLFSGSDPTTKLFRRIWSASYASQSWTNPDKLAVAATDKREALDELFSHFGIDFSSPSTLTADNFDRLIESSAKFENRNPVNKGITTINELIVEIKSRYVSTDDRLRENIEGYLKVSIPRHFQGKG